MALADYSKRLLGLAETLHRWLSVLAQMDQERREKVARYAEEIAATLARASAALLALETNPGDIVAAREAMREMGRIAGYVETMVGALKHHLDGRKLAGVKRRLTDLEARLPPRDGRFDFNHARIDRILAAEGYFRALADGLRV